MQTIFSI